MASKKPIKGLPLGPLADLLAWWRKSRVQGMIIGGLAVALLGRPRTTRDVDALVLVDEDKWPAFLEQARCCGFRPRIDNPLGFRPAKQMLLLHDQESAVDIDISLGNLAFEQRGSQTTTESQASWPGFARTLARGADYLKAVAHRDIDRFDVQGLLEVTDRLDVKRIRFWVDFFARNLELSEVYVDLDRLLSQWSKRKRRK